MDNPESIWLYSADEARWLNEQSKEFVNNYHFKKLPLDKLVENKYNNKGYLYITFIATKLFWWLPDFEAARVFNYLFHLIVSILVLFLFKTPREKLLFLGLYIFNPLIIYVTTYPYYYFWQVIPSFFILLLLKGEKKWWSLGLIIVSAALCAGVFLTRPTVIFSVLILFGLIAMQINWRSALVGLYSLRLLFLPSNQKVQVLPTATSILG